MTPSIASSPASYGSRFLFALIAVSLLPIAVSVLNFGVLDGKSYGVAALYSAVGFASGSHVLMNWTYFASPKWRAHFSRYPVRFYLIPALIVIGSVIMVAQPNKTIGLDYFYAAAFVNIWHHSKQNWGVLSIIGKIRGRNVSPMMKPLCNAWIFFAIPLCFTFPEARKWIGDTNFHYASLACLAAFVIFTIYHASKGRFALNQDPVVLLAGIALCSYFVPLVTFQNITWAVTIWALAHAGQYYMIVFSSLSLNQRKSGKRVWLGMLGVAAIMAIIFGIGVTAIKTGWNQWDNPLLRVVFGAYIGVTLMHFWVDAFIWKFGNAEIRKLHGEAFMF